MPRNINGLIFLDTKDVSQKLDRGPRTVQKWCREGKIPSRKFGNEYLIAESDFNTFLNRLLEPAGAAS